MSSYLLISSAYRDRLLYPNQSDFIVPFQTLYSNQLNLSVLNTINPLTNFPLYTFCWTNFNATPTSAYQFKTTIIGGSGNTILLDSNIYTNLLGIQTDSSSPTGGYILQDPKRCENILAKYLVTINGSSSRIDSYSISYNSISLTDPLSFSIGDEILIENKITDTNYIIINGDFDRQYSMYQINELIVYNMNLNEQCPAIYLPDQYALSLTGSFSQTPSVTDKYILFESQFKLFNGEIIPFDTTGKYYFPNPIISFDIIQKGSFYQHLQLVVFKLSLSHPILPTDTIYRIHEIGPSGTILKLALYKRGSQSFQSSRYYYVKPVETSSSTTTPAQILVQRVGTLFRFKPATLPQSAFRPLDFIGHYFQCLLLSPLFTIFETKLYLCPNFTMPVYETGNPLSLQQNQERNGVFAIHDIDYAPDESSIDILTDSISNDLLYRFDVLDTYTTLPSEFQGCYNSLIYYFIQDGVVPLNFTGSYLTQSQMICCELTVLNLILPNVPIDSLNSFLTSGYPYVLLEISNVTLPSSSNRNSIITNNPYAASSTFVCSISDVNDPLRSKFIKINSDGAIQTLKFSVADNLRFRLLLPNGQSFITQTKDYLPPFRPNPFLQIECLLELKLS